MGASTEIWLFNQRKLYEKWLPVIKGGELLESIEGYVDISLLSRAYPLFNHDFLDLDPEAKTWIDGSSLLGFSHRKIYKLHALYELSKSFRSICFSLIDNSQEAHLYVGSPLWNVFKPMVKPTYVWGEWGWKQDREYDSIAWTLIRKLHGSCFWHTVNIQGWLTTDEAELLLYDLDKLEVDHLFLSEKFNPLPSLQQLLQHALNKQMGLICLSQ